MEPPVAPALYPVQWVRIDMCVLGRNPLLMRRFVASVSALALSTGIVLVPHAVAQTKPSLTVISPGNGDTVSSTDIPVSVQVSNFTLSGADVGHPDRDGEGHIHVMLDGMDMDMSGMSMHGGMMSMAGMIGMPASDSIPVDLSAWPNGQHTITVEPVQDDHTPIQGAMSGTVTLTLQGAAGSV
jgi:hypothetical protein